MIESIHDLQNRPLVYLASPYTHPDKEKRVERFEAACIAAGILMRNGMHVFSPIAHTHPIAEQCKLPPEWDYWQAYDRAVLSCCFEIIVLELDCWHKSKGVREELKIAKDMHIWIWFMQCGNAQSLLTEALDNYIPGAFAIGNEAILHRGSKVHKDLLASL